MRRDLVRRTRAEIGDLAESGLDWPTFASRASDRVRRAVPFDRTCWHPVDPGTVLFTGSWVENMTCSGAWLAHHEYVVEDVNKWAFLARSGYRAGSLSGATHGNLSLSARYRSSGGTVGDELRGSFVVEGTYWGAAGFIRDPGQPWFENEEVRFLASLSTALAEGFRRAFLVSLAPLDEAFDDALGVVVLDEHGEVESVSPAAERWVEELVEDPGGTAADSRVIQAVAARVREAGGSLEVPELPARARAFTRSGRWLLLHGTRLSGGDGRTAVIIQPAPSHEIASLIVQAYGLSDREREVTELCAQGLSTKEIAAALRISPYTVQDHLKAIFEKTGSRSRAELVGKIFLDQYVPRFREITNRPPRSVASETIDTVRA
jgi:DNA-binding CsgD family transcriptional regulator